MGVTTGGTSMVRTVRHNEIVAAACEACPPGRHQPFAGMSNCIPCNTRAGAVGGSVTLENFGDMWYCPPGTGWGSETWRNRAEFSQALDAVAYNASEFVEMYKHAWEAPEQEEFVKVMKNPFGNSTFQVTELNLPYFISGFGWVLTIFIFGIIGSTYWCAKHEFISDERWFNMRDWIKRKDYFEDEHSRELQEGGSFLGGMTTVLFMVWAYSLLGLTAFFFIEFNTLVTQALVPKTEAAVKGLRPDIWIVVKFIGYTGPCLPVSGQAPIQYSEFENAEGDQEWETVPQSSLSWQEQKHAKGLVIKPTGLLADQSRGGVETFETTCSHVPGEFLARYSCTKCIVTSAAVSFDLVCDPLTCLSNSGSAEDRAACAACKEHLISAQMISWKLQSSKILPTEENAVAGKIPSLDSAGNFAPHLSFRGNAETELTISLIPSTYDNLIDGVDGEGYRVQYMKHAAAEGVTAKNFLDGRENAVKFKMVLQTDIVQLELKITPKRSPMEAFAEAGGLFGAVMGLVVVMMNAIEVAQNVWDAITKREDDSESESESASDEDSSSSDESSSSDSDSDSDADKDKDGSSDDSDSDDEEAGKKEKGGNDGASSVGGDSDDDDNASVASASTAVSATSALTQSTERTVSTAKGSSAPSASSSNKKRRDRRPRQESESSVGGSDSKKAPQRKHSRVIDDDESVVSADDGGTSTARKARKGSRMESEKGRRRKSRYADDDLDSVSSKGSTVSASSSNSSASSAAPQQRARKSRSGQQRQSRYARR